MTRDKSSQSLEHIFSVKSTKIIIQNKFFIKWGEKHKGKMYVEITEKWIWFLIKLTLLQNFMKHSISNRCGTEYIQENLGEL